MQNAKDFLTKHELHYFNLNMYRSDAGVMSTVRHLYRQEMIYYSEYSLQIETAIFRLQRFL